MKYIFPLVTWASKPGELDDFSQWYLVEMGTFDWL